MLVVSHTKLLKYIYHTLDVNSTYFPLEKNENSSKNNENENDKNVNKIFFQKNRSFLLHELSEYYILLSS